MPSPDQKTMDKINTFLARPLLARLATSDPLTGQPHVVPVWYLWDGEMLWINSYRGTRKVRDLLKNRKVSVVVDVDESDGDPRAVLLEGEVEILDGPADFMHEKITAIYARYLGPEGVLAPDPQSWMHSPEALLLRLKPAYLRAWS